MKKYLSLIVIAILFVACDSTNDLGTPFTNGQEVTLSAAIGDASNLPNKIPNKNRVTGIDNKTDIQLVWDEGDQIKVIVGEESSIFTLTSGAGSSDGTFTGIMPADGTNFRVEYPIAEPDISTQTYIKDGFSNGLMKMVAENGTIDDGFILKAQHALLGLQLIGNQTLGKIILKDLSGEQAYTLHCKGVKLKDDEATIFYIVVPIEGWENGMLVEVYDKDGVVILRKEKKGKIDFKTTEAMIMPTLEARGPGKRIGVFSVGEGKYVSFSQGNLQYIQSTKTWQFAKEQWEYIGSENIKDGALADKIDLFGWSGKDSNVPFGISTSINNTDYAGEFVDWGINWIGGDMPNTWRTLSIDEWKYLYHERENADKLFALGTINGIVGMILLPDDWQLPEGVTYKLPTENGLLWDDNYYGGGYINTNTQANYYQDNIYTIDQWQLMEEASAVFLPAAGYREKTNFSNKSTTPPSDNVGSYATSTMSDQNNYYFMRFIHREVRKYNYLLHRGRAVRLVHDTIQ